MASQGGGDEDSAAGSAEEPPAEGARESRGGTRPIVDHLFLKSMNWFKGKVTGKPHISWENQWFPAFFPSNQYIDKMENFLFKNGEQHHSKKINLFLNMGFGVTYIYPHILYMDIRAW